MHIYTPIVIFFILNASLSILASIKFPGGVRILTNKSYSMAPKIIPSDATIIKKQPPNSYDKGDIVSFYTQVNGREGIVTHRIYRLGGNVYLTKGDANTAIDKEYLRPRLIIGKVIMVIPLLGAYLSLLKNPWGNLFLILLPAGYIIFTETLKIKELIKKKSEI